MKTCPKCGAENRQTASECRLCATPLESPADLLEVRQDTAFPSRMPPDRILSGPEPTRQHAPASSYAGHYVCRKCKAVNEPDWAFCQQCGAALRYGRPECRDDGAADSQPGPAQASPSSLGAPFVAGARAEPRSPSEPPGTTSAEASTNEGRGAAVTTESKAAPPDPAVEVPVPKPQPEKAVIQMITEGGQFGDIYEITAGELKIGRVDGDVKFPHDGYMSSQHARVVERNGRYFLIDENSRNGTFIRIREEVELMPGDTFLVGKQVFKFGTVK